jgi:hypothetical protein
MSFLFLSYYYPPLQSIAAIRLWQWSKNLQKNNYKTIVLTTSNRHLLAKENCDISQIEIHELPTFDYRTLVAWLRPQRSTLHFEEGIKKN